MTDFVAFLQSIIMPAVAGNKDKEFVRNEYKEIVPPRTSDTRFINEAHSGPLSLGSVGSLIDYIKWVDIQDPIKILVSPVGIKASINYKDKLSRKLDSDHIDYISVPFEFPDSFVQTTIPGFIDFLDQHSGRIKDEEKIRAATRILRTTTKDSVTIEDNGPFTTISISNGKGIESTKGTMPKVLEILMNTGTHEYLMTNTYLIRIKDNDHVTLQKQREHDIRIELVGKVIKDLRASLERGSIFIGDGCRT